VYEFSKIRFLAQKIKDTLKDLYTPLTINNYTVKNRKVKLLCFHFDFSDFFSHLSWFLRLEMRLLPDILQKKTPMKSFT
jgi:hypothetical protein